MDDVKDFTFIFMLFNLSSRTSDDEYFNDQLEAQLLKSRYNSKINILIIYTTFFEIPGSTITIFGTRLFQLVKDDIKNAWGKKLVTNFGNVNMGNQEVLGLIFVSIKSQFKARDYIIYSNAHSNQFGALSDNMESIQKSSFAVHSEIEFTKISSVPPFAGNKYSIEVKPKIDMLTYNEYSKALVNGFMNNLIDEKTDNKIALLLLVSCYSSSVDNLVNFSGSVRYLCLSEGEVFYNFINLTKLIDYLSDPAVTVFEDKLHTLFSNIDNDFCEKENNDYINRSLTEFVCFKLSGYDLVAGMVYNLNKLINYSLINYSLLKIIKEKGYNHTQDVGLILKRTAEEKVSAAIKNSIDAGLFLNNISNPGDVELMALIDKLKKSINKIILTRYKNESDNTGVSVFIAKLESEQLSIQQFEYIATTYSVFSNDASEFSKRTLWPELLQAIKKIDVYKGLEL